MTNFRILLIALGLRSLGSTAESLVALPRREAARVTGNVSIEPVRVCRENRGLRLERDLLSRPAPLFETENVLRRE